MTNFEEVHIGVKMEQVKRDERRRKEPVLEYARNPSGIPVCKLAEGRAVMVSIVRCHRKLKKPIVVLVILLNVSNRQKLMWNLLQSRCQRCRKELDTLCTQTGKSVGPKDMEFNTSSSFKNNQEQGGSS